MLGALQPMQLQQALQQQLHQAQQLPPQGSQQVQVQHAQPQQQQPPQPLVQQQQQMLLSNVSQQEPVYQQIRGLIEECLRHYMTQQDTIAFLTNKNPMLDRKIIEMRTFCSWLFFI